MTTEEIAVRTVGLNQIVLDDQIQTRPLDEYTVGLYAEAMEQDPAQVWICAEMFPPLRVVQEGDKYWLWDGFHRFAALKRVGKKEFVCEIKQGTKRDAFLLSLGANFRHGKPRDAATLRAIIEKIERDPELNKKTDKEIAELVNMSKSRVSKIRQEIRQSTSFSSCTGHIGNAVSTIPQNRIIKPETQILEELEEELATENPVNLGKEMLNQAKQTTEKRQETSVEEEGESEEDLEIEDDDDDKPKVPVDSGGWEIPEHLREIFEQKKILTGLMRQLEIIHGQINKMIASNHPVIMYLNPNAYLSAYRNYHSQLRFAIPYAVCRYCGGDGGIQKNCTVCKGVGWVNEAIYHATPSSLKQ